MSRFPSILFTAALLLTTDIPGITQLRPGNKPPIAFPASQSLPLLPDFSQASDHPLDAQQSAAPAPVPVAKDTHLTERSRLALIRYVQFEFARVIAPLPAGKDGFHLRAGVPLDHDQLQKTLAFTGAAANPGDTAQITNLVFKDRQIVVEINGGGKVKERLRDRIHMEVGGIPTVQMSDPTQTTVVQRVGATLVLDFDRPLPDMSPQDLKSYLSVMLDFSGAHSAAVQWVDTLPPDIQKAIKDGRAAVGMNREMVLTAIGRPDHKVREKDHDGNETEDWIYGSPPAKTVFVTFEGDKVVKVEQFPN